MLAKIGAAASAFALLSAPAFTQPGPGGLFDQFDTNGDGAVTLEEVRSWRTTFFETADVDANGFVTREEIQEMQSQAADSAERRQPMRGRRGGQRDPIARFDTDGDERLSRSEFVDAPFPAIERFDANGDGQLTRDELPGRRRGG